MHVQILSYWGSDFLFTQKTKKNCVVVEPPLLKDMLVKWDHFPREIGGKNTQKIKYSPINPKTLELGRISSPFWTPKLHPTAPFFHCDIGAWKNLVFWLEKQLWPSKLWKCNGLVVEDFHAGEIGWNHVMSQQKEGKTVKHKRPKKKEKRSTHVPRLKWCFLVGAIENKMRVDLGDYLLQGREQM